MQVFGRKCSKHYRKLSVKGEHDGNNKELGGLFEFVLLQMLIARPPTETSKLICKVIY